MGTPVLIVNRFSVITSLDNTGMSIGTRLKLARKAAKLTQVELAKKAGLNQSTLSDLEMGKSAGSTSVAALAYACGVNALWLETGKGDQKVSPAAPSHLLIDDPEEMRILTAFRLADERGQDQINSAVDAVLLRLEQARRYK